MSQALPTSSDCCNPCPSPLIQNIPGPQGPAGPAGTNGTNGVDAFTTLTAPFTMPAEGASVTVAVANSDWMTINQLVFAGKLGSAAVGTFQVIAKPDGLSATLQNLADTPSSAYLDNSPPGTVFASATQVGPAGQQGPPGTNGTSGAPISATYITQTPDGTLTNEQALSALATGLVKNTTVTGVLGIASDGTDYLSPTTGLTKAGNLSGLANAATARSNLGLGSIATQAAGAVTITGGAISGTTVSGASGNFTSLAASGATVLAGLVATTPSALQTLAAANLITSGAGKIRVAGSGGAIVMTSTPTIALGASDGQLLLVQGTHATNTITLQDDGSLAGSKLRLGAASRVLAKGTMLLLSYDATDGFWYEVAFLNPI